MRSDRSDRAAGLRFGLAVWLASDAVLFDWSPTAAAAPRSAALDTTPSILEQLHTDQEAPLRAAE